MAIGLGKMFGFEFLETSIIRMSQKVSRNFGEDGIYRSEHGLRNMCIFLWAETGKGKNASFLT